MYITVFIHKTKTKCLWIVEISANDDEIDVIASSQVVAIWTIYLSLCSALFSFAILHLT